MKDDGSENPEEKTWDTIDIRVKDDASRNPDEKDLRRADELSTENNVNWDIDKNIYNYNI